MLIYASCARTAGANMLSPNGHTLNTWTSILSLQPPRSSIGTIIAYVLTHTDFAGKKLREFTA